MKLRPSLLATVAPVAAGLVCAGPALAAPAVSVRVEGPNSTLLPATTVTPAATGSITVGGTPTGACPADSAAGALAKATHGRFDGTYYKGLGIDVTRVFNRTLTYSGGTYWGFYVDNRFSSQGICEVKPVAGQTLLFAPVPAKGATPRPLVVSAPRTVGAGDPFNIRAYVYPGRSKATRGVAHVTYRSTEGGRRARGTVGTPMTSAAGVSRLSFRDPGTVTIVASAPGTVRSAAVTVRVTR